MVLRGGHVTKVPSRGLAMKVPCGGPPRRSHTEVQREGPMQRSCVEGYVQRSHNKGICGGSLMKAPCGSPPTKVSCRGPVNVPCKGSMEKALWWRFQHARGKRAQGWKGAHIRVLWQGNEWWWESLGLIPLSTIYRQLLFTCSPLVGIDFISHYTSIQ